MKFAIVTIHDACPAFSTNIFKFANNLEKLRIKYNIALVPFFNEKQDLPRFPKFMDNIKSYKGVEIALHGLYHEKNRKRQLDDFHTRSKAAAEEEIRAGLEIFQEVGIKSYVFIPPAWKLNDNSIKVLEKLGFRLAEIQKKFILISQREEFKKIAIPEVLNWDSYGYPHKNIVNIKRNARRFEFLIKKKKSKIIRIALHPRDPFQALDEQIEIVCQLIDQGYKLIRYRELIPILLLERKKV